MMVGRALRNALSAGLFWIMITRFWFLEMDRRFGGYGISRTGYKLKKLIKSTILAIAIIAAPSLARASEPKPFDLDSWKQLVHTADRAVVVFTSTHCVHCPRLVAELLKNRKQPSQTYKVLVVTTDGGASDLGKAPYSEADGRYFFKGNTQALRYSVNPSWRGVTPYVALTNQGGAAQFYSGGPPRDSLERWARGGR
jgi:hypothetical protein